MPALRKRTRLSRLNVSGAGGDKVFHRAKSGEMIILREHLDDKKPDAHGCAT